MRFKLFHRHPLLRAVVALMLGIALYDYFNTAMMPYVVVIIIVSLLFCIYYTIRPNRSNHIVAGILLCISMFLFGGIWASEIRTDMIKEEGRCTISGYVMRLSKVGDEEIKAEFYADTLRLNNVEYHNIKGMIAIDAELGEIEP